MSQKKIVVVGGVNVDISGTPLRPLREHDSNPGHVRFSAGGVGRNIAANLALLGADVSLLTAFGCDSHAGIVEESCRKSGVDLSRALRSERLSTPVYLCLNDKTGDMRLAISDMSACDAVTPDYLEENCELLALADALVCDTNIPRASLVRLVDLAEKTGCPLFCDPVSTAKAEKLRGLLGRIHCLKPNRPEAELLSSLPVSTSEEVAEAAKALLGEGLREVFISMGSQGVCAANGEEILYQPCLPADAVNLTGAGDTFMAALIFAELSGLSLRERALFASAAAALAAETEETIRLDLSLEKIREKLVRSPG